MLVFRENKWIVNFTQSNCYKENQLKTTLELEGKVSKDTEHRNAKKITISNDYIDFFLDAIGNKNKVLPWIAKDFKIYKNEVINLLKDIEIYLHIYSDRFVNFNKMIEIDYEMLNFEDSYIEGDIFIELRASGRTEVILKFGNIIEDKYVNNKKSLFNHFIYKCAIQECTSLNIDILKKEIKPLLDVKRFERFINNLPTFKKHKRRKKTNG